MCCRRCRSGRLFVRLCLLLGVLRSIEEAQFSFSRIPGREFVRVEKRCESTCCVSICAFGY
jgi:hypothetical protein